jgi:AraC family transcriptional regulator
MRNFVIGLAIASALALCSFDCGVADEGGNRSSSKARQIEINMQNLGQMTLACVRHVGPYEQSKPAWDKLMKWAITSGAIEKDATFVGLAHDDPQATPPEKIRFDVCLTIPKDFKIKGDVKRLEAGGARYLHARHVGPYDKLRETYALLAKWFETNEKEFGKGPAIEVYRNDPKTTPPEELITDIYLAIK